MVGVIQRGAQAYAAGARIDARVDRGNGALEDMAGIGLHFDLYQLADLNLAEMAFRERVIHVHGVKCLQGNDARAW